MLGQAGSPPSGSSTGREFEWRNLPEAGKSQMDQRGASQPHGVVWLRGMLGMPPDLQHTLDGATARRWLPGQ